MILLALLVCLLGNTNTSFGQDYTGYFGKRFFTEIHYSFHSPFIRNFTDEKYTLYQLNGENQLTEKRQWFNQGVRWNFGYGISSQFALSLEYGLDVSKLGMPSEAALIGPLIHYTIMHEAPSLMTHSFLVKSEFCGYMGNLPFGLSHDLGIGASITTINNKNYSFIDANGTLTQYNDVDADLQPIDFSATKPVLNYVVMYGLKLRKPITKSLLFTTGIKYFLNLGDFVQRTLPDDVNNGYTLKVEDAIARQRLTSVIYGHFGFTFAF
jgi:hypothetical protein